MSNSPDGQCLENGKGRVNRIENYFGGGSKSLGFNDGLKKTNGDPTWWNLKTPGFLRPVGTLIYGFEYTKILNNYQN